MMAEIVFLALCIAGAFALAMRRGPLWAWAAGLAGATLVWQTGLLRGDFGDPEPGLLGLLVWALVIAVGGLCIPAVRRRALIEPAFQAIKGMMPKVSATEQEALNAGTIGFDAELFSGQPDWEKLRAVPPITLTEEEKAFLDGPTEELCRMSNDWAIRHDRKEIPEGVWDFCQEARLSRHAHLQGAWGPGLLAAGAIAGAGQDFLALARRVHPGHGAELAGARRADREIRHARAEGALPAAPGQGARGSLLFAHRSDVRLRCGHHARRRLSGARQA
jgi:hypothetical protein